MLLIVYRLKIDSKTESLMVIFTAGRLNIASFEGLISHPTPYSRVRVRFSELDSSVPFLAYNATGSATGFGSG